jgi:TPR repeat protein
MGNLLLHAWQRIASEHFSSVDFDVAVRNYERCSDLSPAGSSRFGWCLHTGFGIPIDFTIAAEFFKKAADLNDADGLNSFGCCLEQGQGVDVNIDLAVGYYRKAAKQFHSDGLYNFGRCLEYGKGIDKDLFRAVKDYRLSAELKNASAQNNFGIFLECGIGIHKNLLLWPHSIINPQPTKAIQMVQIILDSAWNTDVELNKTSK